MAAIIGGLGSLLGGIGAMHSASAANQQAKTAQQTAQQQAQLAQQAAAQQTQLYNTAQPYYAGALQTLFGNAGMGAGGGSMYGGINNAVYNAPQQALQLAQANSQLGQAFNSGANQLRFQFNQAGIGGGPLAAALASLQRGQQQQLGEFGRNLAINAVDLQNQRLAQALGGAGIGLGASPLGAASQLGQAAGNLQAGAAQQYNRAGTLDQGLGNAIAAYQQFRAMQQAFGGGGAGGYVPGLGPPPPQSYSPGGTFSPF